MPFSRDSYLVCSPVSGEVYNLGLSFPSPIALAIAVRMSLWSAGDTGHNLEEFGCYTAKLFCFTLSHQSFKYQDLDICICYAVMRNLPISIGYCFLGSTPDLSRALDPHGAVRLTIARSQALIRFWFAVRITIDASHHPAFRGLYEWWIGLGSTCSMRMGPHAPIHVHAKYMVLCWVYGFGDILHKIMWEWTKDIQIDTSKVGPEGFEIKSRAGELRKQANYANQGEERDKTFSTGSILPMRDE
ncbi:hypothetical protein L211DRAFT_889976 [Terfezia boudieri ATCC MYA-4762]|uniref:Uncharacterized protein n=1 Tax=Terfezia boudieri ATCC MYA-4762 TaxID=1051890 RepID=A0A3N4LEU4_9PEZI|nr:hypothetical protein L211DRAFT_889976 [Terfezia boudieri ATCC MYA-4762]